MVEFTMDMTQGSPPSGYLGSARGELHPARFGGLPQGRSCGWEGAGQEEQSVPGGNYTNYLERGGLALLPPLFLSQNK